MTNTKTQLTAIAAILLLAATSGCGKKTPAQTEANVAKAESAGISNVAEAKKDAGEKMADANKDVQNSQVDAGHVRAEAVQKVSLAQATANYKVAVAQCGSLVGEDRKACQSHAEADLAVSKADAGLTKVATDPKL